jgi:hypothetical protein
MDKKTIAKPIATPASSSKKAPGRPPTGERSFDCLMNIKWFREEIELFRQTAHAEGYRSHLAYARDLLRARIGLPPMGQNQPSSGKRRR